jgi:hypothetical protein
MSSLWSQLPEPITTGIGSLPHHNVDSALEFAFRWSLPFLPQIPVRHPKEYMIFQALEGLPGLISRERGEVALDIEAWRRGEKLLASRLDEAFHSQSPAAFRAFEPSAESYSSWQPFLFELGERKLKVAKIQIAGPMTSQWALRLEDGTPADKFSEVGTQIFRLVLAKSVAMARRLKEMNITPVLYVDEPGFYCFSRRLPRHLLGLQELKLFLQALKKEAAVVGLHCCSNTDWEAVLGLGLDVLSIDTTLSLTSLLESPDLVRKFQKDGGRLSLGVIPTAKGQADLVGFHVEKAVPQFLECFEKAGFKKEELQSLLRESIFTPACGLALHKVEDTEIIWDLVNSFAKSASSHCER